jgi:hypothetical protein
VRKWRVRACVVCTVPRWGVCRPLPSWLSCFPPFVLCLGSPLWWRRRQNFKELSKQGRKLSKSTTSR